MSFTPQIKYNPSLSMEDNLKAVVNWVNFLLREMTAGRVPQTKKETQELANHSAEQDAALALTDEVAIELYENQMAQGDKITELSELLGVGGES